MLNGALVCVGANVYVCEMAMCLCGWGGLYLCDPAISCIGVCVFACKAMKPPDISPIISHI